jgi:hypothetical protein
VREGGEWYMYSEAMWRRWRDEGPSTHEVIRCTGRREHGQYGRWDSASIVLSSTHCIDKGERVHTTQAMDAAGRDRPVFFRYQGADTCTWPEAVALPPFGASIHVPSVQHSLVEARQ